MRTAVSRRRRACASDSCAGPDCAIECANGLHPHPRWPGIGSRLRGNDVSCEGVLHNQRTPAKAGAQVTVQQRCGQGAGTKDMRHLVRTKGSHDPIGTRRHRRQRALRHARAAEQALGSGAFPWGTRRTKCCSPRSTGCRSASCSGTGAATITPSAINFRANTTPEARGRDGPGSMSPAVRSRRAAARHFVWSDQFIDRTCAREKSFFGPDAWARLHGRSVSPARGSAPGCVAARGTSPIREAAHTWSWRGAVLDTGGKQPLSLLGCGYRHMTNMPEAKLSREAEICYATWPW